MKTLHQVSPERKVRVAPTFAVGAENQRGCWLSFGSKKRFRQFSRLKKSKEKGNGGFRRQTGKSVIDR
jgi:hypothetical protein